MASLLRLFARLSGSAGPCGVDAEMLKNWLLRHGDHSGRLRDAMATWVDWLSNGSPPYAAYRAVNTVRTVALDKSPGVRPLGIGESWMRLWSDCSHTKTKVAATNACGNTQLCAGLRSGIEANLHAVRAIWPRLQGGLKTRVLRRRRRMVTHKSTRPFVASVLMGCWLPMWTLVRLSMIATPATKRRLASVQLSLMPEMASMS